jgi:tetratricopeptide (TPR) repeat protein
MQTKPLRSINQIHKMLRIGLLVISLIASGVLLIQPIARNQAFTQALWAALRQPPDYIQALSLLKPVISKDCRVNWQMVLLAYRMDTPPDVEPYLNNMLDCTPRAVGWLLQIAPQHEDLALRASQLYPQEPSTWFWLGDLAKTSGDLISAEKYFSESVRLDPTYDLASCRLGSIYEQQGLFQAALDSFWQCCQNGDPGSNGCYGAGRMAEKLNDIPAAIRYYSRSHWLPALQRADELAASK